jgi:hypothetical protein
MSGIEDFSATAVEWVIKFLIKTGILLRPKIYIVPTVDLKNFSPVKNFFSVKLRKISDKDGFISIDLKVGLNELNKLSTYLDKKKMSINVMFQMGPIPMVIVEDDGDKPHFKFNSKETIASYDRTITIKGTKSNLIKPKSSISMSAGTLVASYYLEVHDNKKVLPLRRLYPRIIILPDEHNKEVTFQFD